MKRHFFIFNVTFNNVTTVYRAHIYTVMLLLFLMTKPNNQIHLSYSYHYQQTSWTDITPLFESLSALELVWGDRVSVLMMYVGYTRPSLCQFRHSFLIQCAHEHKAAGIFLIENVHGCKERFIRWSCYDGMRWHYSSGQPWTHVRTVMFL